MRKPRLLLFSAGGTISMTKDPQTGQSVPTLTAPALLALTTVSEFAEVHCVDAPESLKMIRYPADLLALVRCLQHAIEAYDLDGVVITQGTDTLEEVAYFVDEALMPQIPLVFTGAMRPSWAQDSDGVRNLENAFRLVASGSADYGVLVTMHDEVFEAWSVYKSDTGMLDGFAARRGAPRGYVSTSRLELPWRPSLRQRFGAIPSTLPATIPILTMGVADDGVLIDEVNPQSVQGIVIAGMGAGSIPPAAYKRVLKLAQSGIPVVLCSSAVNGCTAEERYYPGAYDELRTAGVAIENHLNARKTRIRLLLSLGLNMSYAPFDEKLIPQL